MKDNLKRFNYERLFALFVFIISRLQFLSSPCGIHLTIFSVNDVISIFDVIFLRTCLFVCLFFLELWFSKRKHDLNLTSYIYYSSRRFDGFQAIQENRQQI